MRPSPVERVGPLLVAGGLLILAARQLLGAEGPGPLHVAGPISGYLFLGTGIFLLMGGRRGATLGGALLEPAPALPTTRAALGAAGGETCRALVRAVLEWLPGAGRGEKRWAGFDQFVRELAGDRLATSRVRCFHVIEGAERLLPLSRTVAVSEELSARGGIVGHVVTSGRPYFRGDAAQGALVGELADQDSPWSVIWPVRSDGRAVGVITLGGAHAPVPRSDAEALLHVVSLSWLHCAALNELEIADRTDKATGVLTRQDFFLAAEQAALRSYAAHEPVVAGVLVVEGLRGLDDHGDWEARDRVIDEVGRTLRQRVRTDDVVGRFADDRFVILLRRLDSALGALILEKIVAALTDMLSRQALPAALHIRAGLAGSGTRRDALETLLVAAFQAAREARESDAPVLADLAQRGGAAR